MYVLQAWFLSHQSRHVGHKLWHAGLWHMKHIINHCACKKRACFRCVTHYFPPTAMSPHTKIIHNIWMKWNAYAFVIDVMRKNMTNFSNSKLVTFYKGLTFHFGLIENIHTIYKEKRNLLCSWHDNICGKLSPAKSQWLILSTRVIWFKLLMQMTSFRLICHDFQRFHFRRIIFLSSKSLIVSKYPKSCQIAGFFLFDCIFRCFLSNSFPRIWINSLKRKSNTKYSMCSSIDRHFSCSFYSSQSTHHRKFSLAFLIKHFDSPSHHDYDQSQRLDNLGAFVWK